MFSYTTRTNMLQQRNGSLMTTDIKYFLLTIYIIVGEKH